MDRKNVYKIVDNVDNSENRRKYRKIAVNKNVRNYLAKGRLCGFGAKKTLWKKENSIFHREQVKRKNDFIFGSKKLLTDFYNVSGTHGDQHVALGKIFVQIVFDFRKDGKYSQAVPSFTMRSWISLEEMPSVSVSLAA